MFTNILVALDGTEISQMALVQAVDQARIWNAKIQAIYTAETPQFNSLPIDQTYGMDTTFENESGYRKSGRIRGSRGP